MLLTRRSIRVLVGLLLVGVSAFQAGILSRRLSAQPPSPVPARGKVVYDEHCAECHGREGKGDGPASHALVPRPRDFTAGKFKIRSTETLPTDEDLLRSVRQGLFGTSMPGWEQVLSADDVQQVVAYVKTFSPRFRSEQPLAVSAHIDPASPADAVARGSRAYQKLQCAKCHGDDGRGTGAAATSFVDDWNQPLPAADLTEPWTFRGGATTKDIFMRFRAGMSGTPMPSFKDAATDAEMTDLATYVISLARKPVWQMTAQEVESFYAKQDDEARKNPVKRGKFLLDTLGCALCHSPLDEEKRLIPGLSLAGGMRIRIEPFGEYPTGNLTSDKETGIGSWTDDEIKRVMTRGILRDGTRLLPYPMDWGSFSTMRDEDLNAIVAYLRTIPPIRNKVPAPRRTALPLYLWGKFRLLILGADPPMIFYAGNIGSAGNRR